MIRSRSILQQYRSQCLSASMLLATSIALSVVACSPGEEPPEVRLNPSPQQHYRITLTIEDPPAEISAVKGTVQFDVKDKKCMPMTDPIAGVWKHTSFSRSVVFRGQGNTYVGDVYTDQLLDEDYFGLGTCKWNLTGVIAGFHVGKIERSIAIRTDDLIEEATLHGVCKYSSITSDICLTPPHAERFYEPPFNFMATIESRKISP